MLLLIECIVACIVFHILVYNSVTKNPISWISSYPPAIRNRLVELGLVSEKQKTHFSVVEVIRKAVAFAVFILLGGILIFYLNCVRTFLGAFFPMLAIMMAITWYDAVVVDCLWFCNSHKVRIKGTEDMDKEYKNCRFHIIESVKGTVISLVISVFTAIFVSVYAGL
ncbi:MAG: hypothetical protein Q4A42_01935 [Tissierellia bacterium]|nr:hypothetical protein [Tissierellia bacterium]